MRYIKAMIKSFADKETQKLWETGRSRRFSKDMAVRVLAKLQRLHTVPDVRDMAYPPGNALEALKGDRKGFWSVRVNVQFRLVFRFDGQDAFDVEVVDYH